MQQTPLRTQKFHAVFNFLVLAALMKLVTHLTVKGKIYNPPVQMRRLNLSSNRLIFSTELKGRKKKCRSFSLFSASLALSCFLPFSSSLTPVGWIRKLQMTKFNTSLTNSIPAPSTPAWGRFLGRPAGSGGQPGAEGHYNRRETLGCGGAQERTLYYDVWPRMAESGHLKHSLGGSIRLQDLQQEVWVDLSHVDPPTAQVQHAADRLLLGVQHHHVGGVRAQV